MSANTCRSFARAVLLGCAIVLSSASCPNAHHSVVKLSDDVFVVPDARTPSVTGWLVVKAGYADEAPRCTGVAHYLEHLLFIGRDTNVAGQVTLFRGGRGNGYTSQKSTVFEQKAPTADPKSVDALVRYFASLMTGIVADDTQALRERDIVLQEYQLRYARSATRRFETQMRKALLPHEPLGQCDIGTPQTLADLSVAEARRFHEIWYRRNNIVMVFHGPVDHTAVQRSVSTHFSGIAAKPLPKRAWLEPIKYPVSREVIRGANDGSEETVVHYQKLVHFTEPNSVDGVRRLNKARSIASSFLASQLPGSPKETLIGKGGVASIQMTVSKIRSGAMRITASATPLAGQSWKDTLETIETYIQQAAEGFSDESFARLKKRELLVLGLQGEDPLKLATALKQWFANHGTYASWQDESSLLEGVTAEQVRLVLRAAAQPGREIVGILEPSANLTAGHPTTKRDDGEAQ